MARPRQELQTILEELLGSRQVYYQPPANVHMKYPAIVYSRYNMWKIAADNIKYLDYVAYNIIVIDKNPDSDIVKRVAKLPHCQYGRHYAVDNLNHDSFTLYF